MKVFNILEPIGGEWENSTGNKTKTCHCKIVKGALNAKVGGVTSREMEQRLDSTDMDRETRGTMLVQSAISENLTISNTCSKKRTSRKWTLRSPNGQVKIDIDYILTNNNIVTNVEAIQRVNVVSDHRLVRGTIKSNTRIERSRMMGPGKFKVNIEVLLLKKEEFQLQLQNRVEVLSEGRKMWRRWLVRSQTPYKRVP